MPILHPVIHIAESVSFVTVKVLPSMQSLKATQAREIDKSTITEAETLALEGRIISQTGKQTMEAGGQRG
jgi:hypothetical protein